MKTPRFWQSRSITSTALLSASLLYRLGASLDRKFTKAQHALLPVISIGNVTAGGAGKTPATLALIPLLQALGHTPHILTRGYKGATLTAHRVQQTDDAAMVGDEALLLAQAAPTWVGRDRLASAQAAASNGATILLCDDALQHHALHKDISFLVIDGPYGIGNGRILPAGPLREPLASAITRCNAVILIGNDAQQRTSQLPLPVFTASLKPTGDTAFLKQGNWLAFAGIGRPEKFYSTLRALGSNLVATRDFPDHHAYSDADIIQLQALATRSNATLITTEKDAVKLPASARSTIHVLPVGLVFDEPQAIAALLTATPAS